MVTLSHLSWFSKDVSLFLGDLLLEQYEERVADFIAKCIVCQKLKVEHLRLGG